MYTCHTVILHRNRNGTLYCKINDEEHAYVPKGMLTEGKIYYCKPEVGKTILASIEKTDKASFVKQLLPEVFSNCDTKLRVKVKYHDKFQSELNVYTEDNEFLLKLANPIDPNYKRVIYQAFDEDTFDLKVTCVEGKFQFDWYRLCRKESFNGRMEVFSSADLACDNIRNTFIDNSGQRFPVSCNLKTLALYPSNYCIPEVTLAINHENREHSLCFNKFYDRVTSLLEDKIHKMSFLRKASDNSTYLFLLLYDSFHFIVTMCEKDLLMLGEDIHSIKPGDGLKGLVITKTQGESLHIEYSYTNCDQYDGPLNFKTKVNWDNDEYFLFAKNNDDGNRFLIKKQEFFQFGIIDITKENLVLNVSIQKAKNGKNKWGEWSVDTIDFKDLLEPIYDGRLYKYNGYAFEDWDAYCENYQSNTKVIRRINFNKAMHNPLMCEVDVEGLKQIIFISSGLLRSAGCQRITKGTEICGKARFRNLELVSLKHRSWLADSIEITSIVKVQTYQDNTIVQVYLEPNEKILNGITVYTFISYDEQCRYSYWDNRGGLGFLKTQIDQFALGKYVFHVLIKKRSKYPTIEQIISAEKQL